MISDRRVQVPADEASHTETVDPAAVSAKELHSFRLSEGTALRPPHPKTLEKLMSELQDAIDRDQQFLKRGEELLARWKVIADRMQQRFKEVLGVAWTSSPNQRNNQ
jgi:hypothetical protein